MFTNRLFNLIVAAVLVVVVALVVQQAFATKAIAPETNNPYTQSKEQALRESQLGERYGVLPEDVARFSAEQINREYILGERYGVMSQQYARNKSYRSPLDECFDVPLREVASCRNASQVPVPSYRSPSDECSDVGLIYRAQCLIESQAPAR
jgi:hypothetical protein